MGRPPNPERRDELLDLVVAYLAEHGLGRVSLRPLADAIGVSTFTLVYHFGDKDGLLAAGLEHAESIQARQFEEWERDDPDASIPALLRRYWKWCAEPDNLAIVRLAVEAVTLSATDLGLPGEHRARLVTAWVDALSAALRREGVPARDARTRATLLNAAFVGLVIDRIATGPSARLDRALELLALDTAAAIPR